MPIAKILLATFSSWFLAQVILKVLITSLREHRFSGKAAFQQGGWPSSHTALVSSLSLSVGLTQGFSSVMFVVTSVFSILVIYEALVTRNVIGSINRLINKKFKDALLSESVGHSLFEVFCGLLIGGLVVFLVFWKI